MTDRQAGRSLQYSILLLFIVISVLYCNVRNVIYVLYYTYVCLYCTVLYCTALSFQHCNVLYSHFCTVLSELYFCLCTVLLCLYCLFCTVLTVCLFVCLYVCLYCIYVLYYTVLSFLHYWVLSFLHCIVLYCTVLYCTVLYCTGLPCPVRPSSVHVDYAFCRRRFLTGYVDKWRRRQRMRHVVDDGEVFYVDRQCGLILYLYLFFSRTQRPTYDRLSELHSGCSIHSIVNESFLSRR